MPSLARAPEGTAAGATGRPRRILEVAEYPPPHTGWAMRVYHLKQALGAQGVDCQVLNVGPNRKVASPHYLSTGSALDLLGKLVWWSLRRYRVHAHMNGDSPKGFAIAFLALFVSRILGNRPVLTFHAGAVQKYFPRFRAPWLTPYYKATFALARHIVCNSAPVKEAIVSYGVAPEKVHAVPAFSVQYLDVEDRPLPEPLERLRSQGAVLICAYVYCRPEFFTETMIDAFAALNRWRGDLHLAVVGGEPGVEIRERVRSQRLAAHVHFLGNQDHDAFVSLLRHAALYLRTPVKDGVATSVLEALHLGVPVVAAENGTRPEGVITYDHRSLDDMVAKMRFALEHPAEARRAIVKPLVEDTIAPEVALLTST